MTSLHLPVLLTEVLAQLAVVPNGIYLDATFGRGGHSQEILKRLGNSGQLFAIDKDPQAITSMQTNKIFQDPRFHLCHSSFNELYNIAKTHHLVGKINGVLLDLGVSSPQLDDPSRGFSFLRDGPLDMRMDPHHGISAAEWLDAVAEDDLAHVLKNYGEEKFARRIANAIVRERQLAKITSTEQLATIVAKANPRWETHKHPATRAFQAIRIFINHELDELTQALDQALEVLMPGGRLLVICFHSLEDKVVKHFLRRHAQGADYPTDLPLTYDQLNIRLKRINGAIRPSAEEINTNPRARSATLRVMEKIA